MAAKKPYALTVFLFAMGGGLTACPETVTTDDPAPLTVGEGCQPLLAEVEGQPEGDCLLPFPSDFFLTDDASLPSGSTIVFEADARPATDEGNDANVLNWRPADGYSRLPPIVARLSVPIAKEGLVTIGTDYDASCADDSKTLIIEATTGRCVPHFVDLDDMSAETPERQTILLRPQELLAPETRYVVALRELVDDAGSVIAAPAGYRYLAEGLTGVDASVDALLPRMEAEVFGPLKREGIEPTTLQLAWSFTTGSEEHVQADMLRVRELALEALENEPPVVEITGVFEDEHEQTWRTLLGSITVPLFLEHSAPGASLNRNDAGEVVQNGGVQVPFIATIPVSVRDRAEPGFPLVYGHGFFGAREEIEYGKQRDLLNNIGAVAFAVDWWGMSEGDIGTVVSSLGAEAHRSMQFSERVPQAMVNTIALSMAIDQGLMEDDAFRRPDDGSAQGTPGELVYEGAPDFLGISQGHILGGTMVALNPYIERAVLQVGGAGLSHMMTRSSTFRQFMEILELAVTDPLQKQATISLMQTHLDRVDPATYAPYLAGAPFPGSESDYRPPVLMQVALSDASVPNFASFFHARQLGLSHIGPSPTTLWGIADIDPQPSGSGLTVFDVGLDTGFYAVAAPSEESPAHEHIRQQGPVQEQMRVFLATGELIYPCEGLCSFPVD